MQEKIFSHRFLGRPVVKKNSKRVYGGRVVYSKAYMDWERAARSEFSWSGQMIEGYVELRARLYYANHQYEADCTNAVEGVQDLLVKMGVIKDDRLFKRVIIEKFFGEIPRAEVEIWTLA